MTDTYYRCFINFIFNAPIIIPDKLSAMDLTYWMMGYEKCREDVVELLKELLRNNKVEEIDSTMIRNIIIHIKNRVTFCPEDLYVEELNGYARCQNDICNHLGTLQKGPRE